MSLEKADDEEEEFGEQFSSSECSKPALQQFGTMKSSRDRRERRSPTSLLLQSTVVAEVIICIPIGPLSLPKSTIVLILNQNLFYKIKRECVGVI